MVKGSRVNVLGLTFKENCSDLRNSKVVDVIRELQSLCLDVHVATQAGQEIELFEEDEDTRNRLRTQLSRVMTMPMNIEEKESFR